MNQILSTGMPNSKNKGKNKTKNYQGTSDIRSVTKFFVIVLLFFGIFMIGTSSYGLYRNMNQDASSQSIPTITVEKSDDTTLLLKVIGENNIDTLTYYWNNGEQWLMTRKRTEANFRNFGLYISTQKKRYTLSF